MFNNKLFNMSLIILIGLTLLGGIAFILWKTTFPINAFNDQVIEEKIISADEMLALSVTTDAITTNLFSKDYIVIRFRIQLDNKEAKQEFEKRLVQAQAIIISVLSSQTSENLRGTEGIDRLNAILMTRFNEILQTGKVEEVSIIELRIQ